MDVEEAYDFFDLLPECEDQEIEDRFRSLAKKYHPDMNRNSSPEIQAENEVLFRQLIEAEEIILKDRALASKRKWEKTLHQKAPKPKEEPRAPKCPYPQENPEVLSGWLKEQLKRQREQRVQNVIDTDFKAMVRNLILTVLSLLTAYFTQIWLFYGPVAYFGFATLLIYMDWNDAKHKLSDIKNSS